MSDPVQPTREAVARQAIARAADATGADFDALLAAARRESSLNASARAGTSSAAGLFQFIEGTWLEMVRRHGAEHGLGRYQQLLEGGRVDAATRREILDLRFDPEIAARMAGELWRENANFLQARLGRAPTENELYAAHVMGPAGALRLIEAARGGAACAADIFPREAAANRHLFYERGGAPRSAQGLLDRLQLDLGGAGGAPSAQGVGPTIPPATVTYLSKITPLSPALLDALFTLATAPSAPLEPDQIDDPDAVERLP